MILATKECHDKLWQMVIEHCRKLRHLFKCIFLFLIILKCTQRLAQKCNSVSLLPVIQCQSSNSIRRNHYIPVDIGHKFMDFM